MYWARSPGGARVLIKYVHYVCMHRWAQRTLQAQRKRSARTATQRTATMNQGKGKRKGRHSDLHVKNAVPSKASWSMASQCGCGATNALSIKWGGGQALRSLWLTRSHARSRRDQDGGELLDPKVAAQVSGLPKLRRAS